MSRGRKRAGPLRRAARRLSHGVLGIGMTVVAWIIERKLLKQIKAAGGTTRDKEATVSTDG